MTIIRGGAFAAGGVSGMTMQTRFGVTTMNDDVHLVADPRNNGRTLAQFSQSALYYGSSNRSELAAPDTDLTWGNAYWYMWRFYVPADWETRASEKECVWGQCHDYNIDSIGRRPTFSFGITNGTFIAKLTHDSAPFNGADGFYVDSWAATPGQEFTIAVRALWADGSNVAGSRGVFEFYRDGVLRYSVWGKNTWAPNPNPDPNPPYVKVGCYMPEVYLPWGTGLMRRVYHVGFAVGSSTETYQTLADYIEAGAKTKVARWAGSSLGDTSAS